MNNIYNTASMLGYNEIKTMLSLETISSEDLRITLEICSGYRDAGRAGRRHLDGKRPGP